MAFIVSGRGGRGGFSPRGGRGGFNKNAGGMYEGSNKKMTFE